jgi:anti-sigma regulatory factor (Ser/Thr protein kinase)
VQGPEASDSAGFVHAALFYRTQAEFTSGVLPFVESAVEAGAPVVVASQRGHLRLLRARLDGLGDRVTFADLASIGPNPARLLGWMQQVTEQHHGHPVRYVHEAVWRSRRPEEIPEVIRHEALINQIASRWQVSVLCPYDLALGRDVIASAERTHPVVLRGGHRRASPSYDPHVRVLAEDDGPLGDPPARAAVLAYRDDLARVRAFTSGHADRAALPDRRVQDLVTAVGELAANTLAHTSGPGQLSIWATPREVICQVHDGGHIDDPLTGRLRPDPADLGGGRGLWVVNQVCDLVQIRASRSDTQIRLHMRLPAGNCCREPDRASTHHCALPLTGSSAARHSGRSGPDRSERRGPSLWRGDAGRAAISPVCILGGGEELVEHDALRPDHELADHGVVAAGAGLDHGHRPADGVAFPLVTE